ncbi:hypothetical protein VOLCADRAFT_92818 [Rhizophagus clarus]|uniref:BED-type domain-containing protein n=1 Tax=Rhizophagus clarus TaxID=94130 RepID=A0A8H3QAR1_9GLOM|nr:hypothetical protein VOLCADRAFT_92818 [Rhizophagus clarus]
MTEEQQNQNGKSKRQGGRPREQIWNYYDPDTHRYRNATCNYCPRHWGRGEIEVHLANECLGVSEEVKNYW